jgi:hypothetical protein
MKGINPFERHVEKFVFALFALFVMGVLLLQTGLLGGSRTVKVGSTDFPLDGALAGVKDLALQRQSRLQSDQVASGVPESLPDPVEVFESAKSGDSAPLATLATLGAAALRSESTGSQAPGFELPKGGDARFAELALPKPAAPLTIIFEGTIDPIAVAEIGAPLAAHLPPQQPFDARIVSVESAFDAAALRKSIEAPDAEGVVALPDSFWHGRVELIDVEWTRQQRGSDGQWGDEQILESPPGTQSLRAVATKADFQPGDFKELLDRERTLREDLRHPEFYPTITGRSWTWPSLVRKEIELKEAPEIIALKRELADTRRRLEESRRALERLLNKSPAKKDRDDRGGTPPGKGPPPGGGGGPGGSADASPARDPFEGFPEDLDRIDWPEIPARWLAQGLGGGGGGGRDGDKPEGPSTDEKRKEREALAKKRLEDQIAQLEKREHEILDELAKKGVADKGDLIQTRFAEPHASLASPESEKITLWTHDLSVRPGGAYRYKARVRVTNPYYGQADRLQKDQQRLAEDPFLVSDASEWSEPVAVEPDTVYFVTSASEPGGPLASASRAGAEIYHFFYGYWRKTTVSMTPGDVLAGAVELPAEWTTFTLERDAGQKWIVKDRPAVEKKKPLNTGIFLLDTAAAIGGKSVVQAYFRDPSGDVIVRKPTEEPADTARRARLQTSSVLASSAIVREPGTVETPKPSGEGQQPPDDRDGDAPPIGGGPPKKSPPPPGSPPGPRRERN